ncbi:MAG: hypothetical protein FD153_562 [Rhodospirillaceae bacterium]|nr:MAG: hypothetical protein FD153_562 [Rhodospirillaceae bacterium]
MVDDCQDYGETSKVDLWFIGHRLHSLVYAERGDALRVISLRKANKREVKAYAESLGA